MRMTGAAMDGYESKLVAALQENATLRTLVQNMVDDLASDSLELAERIYVVRQAAAASGITPTERKDV
jgi:hypothetical protein